MRRRTRLAPRRLLAVVALAVAGCAGPASSTAPPSTPGGTVTPTPVAAATDASEAPTSGTIGVYELPEGQWRDGMVHVVISGGIERTLELPLEAGETVGGRTTLTFEHQDPADSRWSLGLVRLSFFPDADSFGVVAGGVMIQGPCTYALGLVAIDEMGGELRCDDDVQATFEGDPREVTVSGSFSAAR